MIQFIKAEKNVALDIIVPCYDGEWSSAYVTAPTAPDSEKSQDKGAFADCTNEWTEIDTSGVGHLTLTQAEMNYDLVIVKITSSTVGANFPLVEIHTETNTLGSVNTELAAIPASTATLAEMIQYLFEKARHKSTMDKDTGVETMMKDDGTTSLGTATHSDDGTTVTKGEMA